MEKSKDIKSYEGKEQYYGMEDGVPWMLSYKLPAILGHFFWLIT